MAEVAQALVDGEWASSIPLDDRGFLFGDHVFETLLLYGAMAPLWPLHWQRLRRGCDALGIHCPDEGVLLDDLARLATHTPQVVRITLTRGSSPGGYWPSPMSETRRVVHPRRWPAEILNQREHGLTAMSARHALSTVQDMGHEGLKHGNRLAQVTLALEAQAKGVEELLVYRHDGSLAEGIASNVVLSIEGQLKVPTTPEVSGVGIEWLRHNGVISYTKALGRRDVETAGEIMMVNAIAGVRPVALIDGRAMASRVRCPGRMAPWRLLLS
mgnify:CR=1 FL=1